MPKIVSTMKQLGYFPDEKGVCFGIAAMGAQAVIREEPKSFYDRIMRIHNLTNETIKSILKEKKIGKTDDLFYFFDGVSIYHGLSALSKDVADAFDRVIPKQSIDNRFLFKNCNDAIKNVESQNKKFNFASIKEQFVCYITIKELSCLILELKSELKNQAFSLMIHNSDDLHTMQLGFSGNNWLVVNHDIIKIYEEHDIDISGVIKGILPVLKQEKENRFNLQIDILLSEQTDIDLAWVKKYQLNDSQIIKLKKNKKLLANLVNGCAFANQYQMLNKIFQHVDIASIANEMINDKLPITMLLAEASDSHIETVNALFEVMKKSKLPILERARLIKGKCENEVDALYMAVYQGNIKTAKAFLRAIEETELTDELRMSLLKANGRKDVFALYVAAYDGNTEMVKMLLESIEKAKFSKANLFSLLKGKDGEGSSALSMAVQEDHSEIVKLLLASIEKAKFTPNQCLYLLEAKNSNGDTTLNIAAHNGNKEIVQALLNTVEKIPLTPKQRFSFLEARGNDEDTALLWTMWKNHTDILIILLQSIENAKLANEECALLLEGGRRGVSGLYYSVGNADVVRIWVQAVEKMPFSAKQRLSLLQGKDTDGNSALSKAIYFNHIETVKVLLQGIEKAQLSKEQCATLLEGIYDDGTLALSTAANKGYTDIVIAVLEAIEKMSLTTEQRKALLGAKDIDGNSALSMAVQEGHMDITVALVQAIDNLDVSDEEKVTLLESRNKKGLPSLLIAVLRNKIEIAKYLFEYILSSDITVDKKIELLQANVPPLNTCLYKFTKKSGDRDLVKYLRDTIANSSQFTKIQKTQFFKYF